MSETMKTIILIGDGMADSPLPDLNGLTPLMAADTPAMDQISSEGRNGLFQTIKPNMPAGSAVANLSILGYDPQINYQGRGVLEAASLGITLTETDLAMRINLINVEQGRIRSHSAGHISTEEAHQLIYDLQNRFRQLNIKLVPGLSYRHVLVVPNGDANLKCAPPHNHVGEPMTELLVKPLSPGANSTSDLLNRLITESQAFLENHPINRERMAAGLQPGNSLWPWSPGLRPKMITFQERFGIHGAVITAVDAIKGLGIYAGFEVIPVKGATGLFDTNYEGKADACLKALEDYDLVYVHVEAPDEAGHQQDLELKIRCIEEFDKRLIQRVLDGLQGFQSQPVVALLPDHSTPVALGTHTRDPVPVAIRDPSEEPDSVNHFDEVSAKSGRLAFLTGADFINLVLRK